jgi:hypothetical protein
MIEVLGSGPDLMVVGRRKVAEQCRTRSPCDDNLAARDIV